MIIFATHHDESTAESLKYAKSIIEENDLFLLKDDAIRQRLLLLSLTKEDIAIFLQKLSVLCNTTEQNYLQRYPENLDFIGVSTTLRNIWAKLEIWFTHQKYIHSDAIEPPLW